MHLPHELSLSYIHSTDISLHMLKNLPRIGLDSSPKEACTAFAYADLSLSTTLDYYYLSLSTTFD